MFGCNSCNWFGTDSLVKQTSEHTVLHSVSSCEYMERCEVFCRQAQPNAALCHIHTLKQSHTHKPLSLSCKHIQTQMDCTTTKGRVCYTDETTLLRKKLKKLKIERKKKTQRGGINYLEWANACYWYSRPLISSVGLADAELCWCVCMHVCVLCSCGWSLVFGSWAFCYIRPCGYNNASGKPMIMLHEAGSSQQYQPWHDLLSDAFSFLFYLLV